MLFRDLIIISSDKIKDLIRDRSFINIEFLVQTFLFLIENTIDKLEYNKKWNISLK